ncbi:MAG: hypothetical protein KAU95_01970 [Candidatus Aenigmarchaeota archaeon]|nr:hypothetical protein [Candidatus Aenigmarchaeota archaeon]
MIEEERIGIKLKEAGKYSEAIKYFEDAIDIYKQDKNWRHASLVCGEVYNIYYKLNKGKKAKEYLNLSVGYHMKYIDELRE